MHDDDDDDAGDATKTHSASALAAMALRRVSPTPYLIVVKSASSTGKMFKLTGELSVGRKDGADLRIDDEGVSRLHARLRVTPEGVVEVTDLDSTNGTFCNGDRVTTRVLQDGDKLQIGGATILKFSYQDAIDEELQANLYDSATRDGLTRVQNKNSFLETLRSEFAYARRHQSVLALIMFDVDHFKKINDAHGHPTGDYVLQKLAATVGQCLRAEDTLARYGGEEFAIVLRETAPRSALRCAERVRASVESAEFARDGESIPVTVSLGVATYSGSECDTPEALIELADGQLYAAKRSGRNRVASADGSDDG